jgi:hypothetical protein
MNAWSYDGIEDMLQEAGIMHEKMECSYCNLIVRINPNIWSSSNSIAAIRQTLAGLS